MIKDKCFTEEWLDQFKKQKNHKRIDKIILGKMIYALHLLERLKANGLDFVFRGGTSLVLLLKEGNRFSIDLDIICNTGRKELENILNKVIETSYFKEWSMEDHEWNFLNKLKKQPDKSSFYYWYQTVLLLTTGKV